MHAILLKAVWWVVLAVHVDVHGEWVMLWVAAMYDVFAILIMTDMVLSCLYAEAVESMSSTGYVLYMVCMVCWSLSYVVKFYCS